MKYPENSSPNVFDDWFENERGTELDEDDMPDFDSCTDKDEY